MLYIYINVYLNYIVIYTYISEFCSSLPTHAQGQNIYQLEGIRVSDSLLLWKLPKYLSIKWQRSSEAIKSWKRLELRKHIVDHKEILVHIWQGTWEREKYKAQKSRENCSTGCDSGVEQTLDFDGEGHRSSHFEVFLECSFIRGWELTGLYFLYKIHFCKCLLGNNPKIVLWCLHYDIYLWPSKDVKMGRHSDWSICTSEYCTDIQITMDR